MRGKLDTCNELCNQWARDLLLPGWITWSRGLFGFQFHVLFYFFGKQTLLLKLTLNSGISWFLKYDSVADGTALEKREQLSLWHLSVLSLFWCPQEDGGIHFLGMAVRQVIKRQQSITIHPRLNKRSCYGLCGKCKPLFLMRYCPPFRDATQCMFT